MPLTKIDIHHFRNLESVFLNNFSPSLNLLYGKNASGKTSFLEAIYSLSTGKSFRSKRIQDIITHQSPYFSLFGLLESHGKQIALGIEKHQHGDSKIRIDNSNAKSAAELAEIMPIQLLTPHIFHLMETGPEQKRRYIDWSVFHVEQCFLNYWRNFKRALKQRNAALKSYSSQACDISLWDNELEMPATAISEMRSRILEKLFIIIKEIGHELLKIDKIGLKFLPGWDTTKKYQAVLSQNLQKDRIFGFTQHGPHRADIKVYINGKAANEVLSRGQQKLFVSAMMIAQGILLKQETNKQCIYLIDDLASELDKLNRNRLLGLLSDLGMQVFATCVEKSAFEDLDIPSKVFHVEHGVISSKETISSSISTAC